MIHLNLDNRHMAETYDAVSDSQFGNGVRLVDALKVKPGNSVLDIGCGTGRLGFFVVEKIGGAGSFIGIDPLEERVKIAQGKNHYINTLFRTGIAEDLGFIDTGSIDIVYLSAVFHWITDKPKALAEIFRVLKPGGRVGLTTLAKELAHIATFRRVTDLVLTRQPYKEVVNPDEYPTSWNGVTTTELVTLFIDTGLTVQRVELFPSTRTYETGSDVVEFLESSTFGNFLTHVPESLRQQAREEVAAEFDRNRTPGGIDLTTYTILAKAAKTPVN